MESPHLPFLGAFSKLPTEIRLVIWADLFSEIHTQSAIHSKPKTNPLSILSASGYLYREISVHLYSNMKQTISVNREYDRGSWMTIKLKSRVVDVTWNLKDKADAERYFQSFPYQKASSKIEIRSPDTTDPGQVVLIWQKVNHLLDNLMTSPCQFQDPEVFLTGHNWHSILPPPHWRLRKRCFSEMGGLRQSIPCERRFYCPDYDIVMMPFARAFLKDVPEDPSKMTDEEFDRLHQYILAKFSDSGAKMRLPWLFSLTKETIVPQIEKWLLETEIFMEDSLDNLTGRTACFLRLDRFQSWYKDGNSWESPYEKRFLEKLDRDLKTILEWDPGFTNTIRRWQAMILNHHYIRIMVSPQQKGLFGWRIFLLMDINWDSAAWSELWPTGIQSITRYSYVLNTFDSQVVAAHCSRLSRIMKQNGEQDHATFGLRLLLRAPGTSQEFRDVGEDQVCWHCLKSRPCDHDMGLKILAG
jgi:hypothetical protein